MADISTKPSVALTKWILGRSSDPTSRSRYSSMPSPLYTNTSVSFRDSTLDMLGSQPWASTPGGRNCSTVAADPATFLVNS